MTAKIIFVTGGVVSSLGKGITSASIAILLQMRGYKVSMKKLDPYLNLDPGTMSPYQHGEVFVTDDGAETDLDLGHYERFTGICAKKTDNLTSGQVYEKLLSIERQGGFLGVTVQVIPHVTNLIKEFILQDIAEVDFLICEVGGTVGDIEALPYFEAIRQLGYQYHNQCIYVHLTFVPYLKSAKEIKTKPTQHSVKQLLSIGIQPDVLVCRSEMHIPMKERNKIAAFCNIAESRVIEAVDQDTIYKVPLAYHQEGLDREILTLFNLPQKNAELQEWQRIINKIDNLQSEVVIDIVGKYNQLEDAYKSLVEAFFHAGISNNCKVRLNWIDAEQLTTETVTKYLKNSQGIMVPGGFGQRGTEGKILAIQYAREHNIPFFGICLGMQLAVIEFARNVLGIKDACSEEISNNPDDLVIKIDKWIKEGKINQAKTNLGGTMRLGAYPCTLVDNTVVKNIYNNNIINERHRHRYEINIKYFDDLEKNGLKISGISEDKNLIEIVEISSLKWFIAVQFHPEFKSRLLAPHPLFISFIKTIMLK